MALSPDEIQRKVGEPEVFLERRRMPDPLAKPLTQHEARITEPQQVPEEHIVHRFLTSSGMA